MRTSSKILVFLFFVVTVGLIYFVNKADEEEINAAVEARLEEAFADREQELDTREQTMQEHLADQEQAQQARLDSALARMEQPVYVRLPADTVEHVLRRLGLTVERGTDSYDDPTLTFKLATYTVTMFFYDCQETGCSSLRLFAGFSLDAPTSDEMLNDWNSDKRFSTAYRNDEGWACLDEDLVLRGGVTLGAVEQFVLNFRERLGEYARHVGA